jgi:S-methylmethionine-dependent homocysteine/selenocysteine methylase
MLRAVLRDLIEAGTPILADAAIETRIMFETEIELDPHLQVAALLDDERGRDALREIYATYVDVAWAHGLPGIIGTPTFRASLRYVERARRGGLDTVRRLNAEAAAFLSEIRARGDHQPVFIGGVLGPYGDAYTPADCLARDAAADYHAAQAEALSAAGVDFLFAATFPAIDEAHGAAVAMARTDLPYAVSFVLDREGALLDGTPLHEAIERIDGDLGVDVPPTHYSISCVHPTIARRALERLHDASRSAAARLREVKANGSPLTPEQLVALDHVESDEPDVFGEEMHRLGVDFGIAVLGGCCGTDATHLAALARRLEVGAA